MSKTPLSVLFVDDSNVDVKLLLHFIAEGGYEISYERVETPKALTASLQEKKWDIIISDYSMPAFNGIEALKILTGSGLDIPFILVSGIVDEELAVEAMRLGASDYIMKSKLKRLGPAIQRELKEADMRRGRRRMGKELDTAKLVQATLFPQNNFSFPGLEISGFYEPASECGGDWWHYCEIENKIFLWIGDVTGHGVAAALITSAARSAVSVLEGEKNLTPARAMQVLNKAIYDTSKAQIMMTFFIASIDKVTGELIYCNASHEAPLLLRKSKESDKRELMYLNKNRNPRLGESPSFSFRESSLNLETGDLLFFLTDGLFDLKNPEKISWGEKKFLSAILKFVSLSSVPKEIIASLTKEISEFRQGTSLEDDVTYFVCNHNGG